MGRRPKKFFSNEVKRKAVSEYESGVKTALQVATELGVVQGMINKWKVQLAERVQIDRTDKLIQEGKSPEDARRIMELEEELSAYKDKAMLKKEDDPIIRSKIIQKLVSRVEISMEGITIHFHVGKNHFTRELESENSPLKIKKVLDHSHKNNGSSNLTNGGAGGIELQL